MFLEGGGIAFNLQTEKYFGSSVLSTQKGEF